MNITINLWYESDNMYDKCIWLKHHTYAKIVICVMLTMMIHCMINNYENMKPMIPKYDEYNDKPDDKRMIMYLWKDKNDKQYIWWNNMINDMIKYDKTI